MRERDIERWATDLAHKHGWWRRKFTSPNHRSAPDRIFAKAGVVFFVEFKAPGEVPTPLQAQEHKKMRDHGLSVYVIDSCEKFAELLRQYERVV